MKELDTTREHWRTRLDVSKEPPSGLDAVVHAGVGRTKRRRAVPRQLLHEAGEIDARRETYRHLSNSRLQQELQASKSHFRRHPTAPGDDAVHEALAALREAAERCTGLRPYNVQLAGALALHRGFLIEMATGEGKTLVAAVAAVLGGWTRRPCHIVTVNDYLAQRDAEWFKPLYQFCSLDAAAVLASTPNEQRRQGYDADITYTTAKEILADFLRDRLKLGDLHQAPRRHLHQMTTSSANRRQADLVMRGLHTAIVDEADSVLIDEAVTPLILSQQTENRELDEATMHAREIADTLTPNVDFRRMPRYKDLELTEKGKAKIAEQGQSLGGIWRSSQRWTELIEQALTAREYFHKDHQYVLQEERVVIVDEFTGRLMPQRTWRHGLQQAIEAKEGIPPTPPSETLSRLSFQRFFRFFHTLSGMTGTAREAQKELWHIYHLPVIPIPTHRPCIRRTKKDRIFAGLDDKWTAVVEEISRIHADNRPVLIGTRSVHASLELAERLDARELEYNLLNAVRHRDEARIVAEAGAPGKITIATNMAGRGTDIKLGRGVAEKGGLHVLATERHESPRIDRQLFGRCARQGEPGDAQAFISLEDDLFKRFLPAAWLRPWLITLSRLPLPGQAKLTAGAVKLAQTAARHQARKQRKKVMEADTWMQESLSFAKGPDRLE